MHLKNISWDLSLYVQSNKNKKHIFIIYYYLLLYKSFIMVNIKNQRTYNQQMSP